MSFALELAKKGIGLVEPNPAVGCVILDAKNNCIGYGFHEKFGGAHAEVNALNSIKDKSKLKGAKVIVTLEPCGHEGKTPACSAALINAGVGQVIYGVSDPNKLFNHKGLEELEKNNITVVKFSSDKQILLKLNSLVEKFIFSLGSNRPFISIKMGSSLDGQIALENKESKWITGNESRKHAHLLRAGHDATLIGVDTLIDDDPSLNVRLGRALERENKIIILDPKFRSEGFLLNSNLVKNNNKNNIYIVCGADTDTSLHQFNFIKIKLTKNNKINLNELSLLLRQSGITSILVEGGAGTISEFLKQGMFDRIYNFISPSIIGSNFGLSWTKGLSSKKLSEKIMLHSPEIQRFGDDFLLSYKHN